MNKIILSIIFILFISRCNEAENNKIKIKKYESKKESLIQNDNEIKNKEDFISETKTGGMSYFKILRQLKKRGGELIGSIRVLKGKQTKIKKYNISKIDIKSFKNSTNNSFKVNENYKLKHIIYNNKNDKIMKTLNTKIKSFYFKNKSLRFVLIQLIKKLPEGSLNYFEFSRGYDPNHISLKIISIDVKNKTVIEILDEMSIISNKSWSVAGIEKYPNIVFY